jgi:hypothetical protein
VEAWAEKTAKEQPAGTYSSHGELGPPGWPYEADVQVGGDKIIWIHPKTKGGTTVIIGPTEGPRTKGNPVVLSWGQKVWFINWDTLTRQENKIALFLLAVAAGCATSALAFGQKKNTPTH